MGIFVNMPVNRDFRLIQYRISQILLYVHCLSFYNPDGVCLPRGTDWVFK
jgi:hypothetical protein